MRLIPIKIKRSIKKLIDTYQYPYQRINTMPQKRPSRESIYYLINQLGKNSPVGLTHKSHIGYHELPFSDLKFKVSRNDLEFRLDRICEVLNVDGKRGLDIGSALGGITFGLQLRGSEMFGIERDKPSILVSRECENLYKTGAEFIHGSVSSEVLNEFFLTHGKLDFCVWFSSFNWVIDAIGRDEMKKCLGTLSENVEVLLADSAIGGKGTDPMARNGLHTNDDFRNFVMECTCYNYVDVVGNDADWYGRKVFKFSK
jgi:hypothetical protein